MRLGSSLAALSSSRSLPHFAVTAGAAAPASTRFHPLPHAAIGAPMVEAQIAGPPGGPLFAGRLGAGRPVRCATWRGRVIELWWLLDQQM